MLPKNWKRLIVFFALVSTFLSACRDTGDVPIPPPIEQPTIANENEVQPAEPIELTPENPTSNNDFYQNTAGIFINYASNFCTISDNLVRECTQNGIRLGSSSNNTVSTNTVEDSSMDGIYLYLSHDNDFLQALSNFKVKNLYSEIYNLPSIPGKVEAENFVDQFGINIESTSDSSGGSHITDIDTDDWLEYDVSVVDAIYFFDLFIDQS